MLPVKEVAGSDLNVRNIMSAKYAKRGSEDPALNYAVIPGPPTSRKPPSAAHIQGAGNA
jgi:hypothetical protein